MLLASALVVLVSQIAYEAIGSARGVVLFPLSVAAVNVALAMLASRRRRQ